MKEIKPLTPSEFRRIAPQFEKDFGQYEEEYCFIRVTSESEIKTLIEHPDIILCKAYGLDINEECGMLLTSYRFIPYEDEHVTLVGPDYYAKENCAMVLNDLLPLLRFKYALIAVNMQHYFDNQE